MNTEQLQKKIEDFSWFQRWFPAMLFFVGISGSREYPPLISSMRHDELAWLVFGGGSAAVLVILQIAKVRCKKQLQVLEQNETSDAARKL